MQLHEVIGCKDCPFAIWDKWVSTDCQHPDQPAPNDVSSYLYKGDGDLFPVWCPLKKEPITIKLVEK